MKNLSAIIFGLGVLFLGQNSLAQEINCKRALKELNFNAALPYMVSQLDTRFKEAGLRYRKISYLCGPTCIINMASIFRLAQNVRDLEDPVNQAKEIMSQAEELFDEQGLVSDPRQGLTPDILAELLRSYFDSTDIKAHFKERIALPMDLDDQTSPITLEDLFDPESVKLSIIIVRSFNDEKGIDTTIGHSLLAVAFPEIKNRLFVIDPLKPSQFLELTPTPAKLQGSEPSFIVNYVPPMRMLNQRDNPQYFIQSAVIIDWVQ